MPTATHKMGGDSVITNTLGILFTDGTEQFTAATAGVNSPVLSGTIANIPTLLDGQLYYATDTNALYIGPVPTQIGGGGTSLNYQTQSVSFGTIGSADISLPITINWVTPFVDNNYVVVGQCVIGEATSDGAVTSIINIASVEKLANGAGIIATISNADSIPHSCTGNFIAIRGGGSGGSTAVTQAQQVAYTITPNDENNQYANVPVTWATPFADTNYSVEALIDLPNLPTWQANTAYALGDIIQDSNGMIQQVTTAGTSGATVPTWTTGPAYSGTTVDNTVTWTVYTIGDFTFLNGIKLKTAAGFVAEIGAYYANTPFSLPVIIDVVAVHD
jgi:hypothetical protein